MPRVTACRIIQVKGNAVEVADLEARNGTPILDLTPHIPGGDAIPAAVTPEWLKRSGPRPISNTVLSESRLPPRRTPSP